MERLLLVVPGLADRLANPDPVEADTRVYELHDDDGHPTGEFAYRDPATALLPMGAIPPRSGQPIVSGSHERRAPIDIDAVDLTAPARTGAVHDGFGDQVGHLSAATVLDSWVRCFREDMWPGQRLPAPTVPTLSDWLRLRLGEIIDQHEQVADFAAELRSLVTALHGALGENEPPPDVLWGMPCKRCGVVSALMRAGDGWVECGDCGILLTAEEYRDWLMEIIKVVRYKRPPLA